MAAPSTTATYYYYDGWNLIQEGPSGGTAARVYVHGGRVDEIVASWGNGQWYSHHYDAQGNCIMLTDANGLIQEQYDYDAFGLPYVYRADGTLVPLKLGSPAGNRFLFTGREWIKDHRIYDYRNRMYQPELGRFLQPDPKQFAAGDYNLYRYCHNDPVNRSDPMGLTWADLMAWQRGGLGTVTEQSETIRIQQRATAAMDHWAPWAKANGKEVAGTVKVNGETTVGPESDRYPKASNPGPITGDTAAIWHLHLLLPKTAPYKFSAPKDVGFITRHSTLAHYVGVVNAPAGQFTIFAHTPEMPYMHFTRLGPQPFPQPPLD